MTNKSLQDQLSSLLKDGRLQVPAKVATELAAARAPQAQTAGLRRVKLAFARPSVSASPEVPTETALPGKEVIEQPAVTPTQQVVPNATAPTTVMEAKAVAPDLGTEKLRSSVRSLVVAEPVEAKAKRLTTAVVRARRLAEALTVASKSKTLEARQALQAARFIVNSLVSIKEAHGASDASDDDLRHVKHTCTAQLETIEELLAKTKPATEEAVTAVRLQDMKSQHFQQYVKFRSRLPQASKMKREEKRFVRLVSPVIVIFNHPRGSGAADLEALGFEATADGDYVVLHEQEIWAISPEVLNESEAWEGDEASYVQKCLRTYQRRTGTKAVVLGTEGRMKIGHASTPGISYYWIMPEREFKALPSSIKEWGFPF